MTSTARQPPGEFLLVLGLTARMAYAYSFDPYGTAVLTAGGGGGGEQQNPYLFKGGIQDRTTGWAHFGARWYNPTTAVVQGGRC
ncbi:RHS repeat-associated core domain-containing protein [Parafrigoribacterium soli]|uniref:hypothetical protein n=1 Tax=Parafrigoribacterium soli TaxID=3144663 RepID=UPI0032EEC58D